MADELLSAGYMTKDMTALGITNPFLITPADCLSDVTIHGRDTQRKFAGFNYIHSKFIDTVGVFTNNHIGRGVGSVHDLSTFIVATAQNWEWAQVVTDKVAGL